MREASAASGSRSSRSGVMWSWRCAPTVRRAAALMTDCRRSRSTGVAKGGPKNGFTRKFLAAPLRFGSQISLITAMGFREAMPPRTTHQGLCPCGGLPFPDPLCPHLQILATPLFRSQLGRPATATLQQSSFDMTKLEMSVDSVDRGSWNRSSDTANLWKDAKARAHEPG